MCPSLLQMKHFRPSSVGSATRSLFCGFVWYLLFFVFSLFSLRVPVRWALYVLIVSFFSLLCCSVRLFVSVNLVYLCFHLFPLVFLFLFVLAMFFGLFRLSRRLFCLLSVSSFFFSPPCLFGRAWSFLFYLFMLWVSVAFSLSLLFFGSCIVLLGLIVGRFVRCACSRFLCFYPFFSRFFLTSISSPSGSSRSFLSDRLPPFPSSFPLLFFAIFSASFVFAFLDLSFRLSPTSLVSRIQLLAP